MEEKKENKGYFSALKGFRRAVPIILIALALFIAVCFLTADVGAVGSGISSLLCGLFSAGAYAIPPLLLVHGIFYAEDVAKKRVLSRAIFGIIAILLVSAVEYAIVFWGEEFVFAPTEFYASESAGGLVGSTVAFGLVKALGSVGTFILAGTLLAIYIVFFFSGQNTAFGRVLFAILSFLLGILALIEKGFKKIFGSARSRKEKKRIKENNKKNRQLLDDQFFKVDNGISELRINELGIAEGESTSSAKPSQESQEKDADASPAAEHPTEKKKRLNLDYGLEHGMFDAILNERSASSENAEPAVNKETSQDSSRGYGLDESADKVFTQDFDPFDFTLNQKIASKPSSRAIKEESAGISEIARPLSSMTNEEIDAQRRRMEFERKKKMIIDMRNKSSGSPASNYGTSDYTSGESVTNVSDRIPTQKTVEFNVSNEPSVVDRTPTVGSSFRGTFEKQDYREHEAEQAAARVAEIVAMNNPAYAKSSNEVYAYVKITDTQKEPLTQSYEQSSADSYYKASESELGYTRAEESRFSQPSSERYSENGYSQPYRHDMQNDDSRFNYSEVVSVEPTLDATIKNAPYEEPVSSNIPIVESSIPSSSFESPQQSRATESSPIFKPYTPAPTEEPLVSNTETAQDTLKIERSMLSPTPAAANERDKKYTLLSDDMQVLKDDEAEEEEDKSDYSFIFENNDNAADSAKATATAPEEGTVFSFDDDSDEDEDEDSGEEYSEMPEDELITSEEIPPEEQNPEVLRQRAMFPFLDSDNSEKENSRQTDDTESSEDIYSAAEEPVSRVQEPAAAVEEEPKSDEEDEPPFEIDEPIAQSAKASVSAAVVPASEAKREKEAAKKPDYSDFVFPPIELLGKDEKSTDENVDEEIQDNADKLIETLASFNVTASIKGVDRGPRITRYEVVPAKGVKVSSVMNLQDDIALGLAAEGIRMEAPIPGKSAIGVEIPNEKEETVRLRELLETEDFINAKSKTTICIGKDVTGQPVINDIAKMPHLLIAGATGMGKSVCINSLMISILYKARPDEVKFIMVDPKQVEFTMYNGIPHLLVPVVSDAKQAAGALMWAVEEMERRYNILNTQYVRNVDAYNEKVKEDPSIGEPMSRIVIVIDEFADLMLQVRDPVENLVMRIAQKARAAGIHLIIGTQRPAVNVITGTIKANVPSRISCKVASNTDSRTVLDAGGAEKLLNKGDMLFSFAGAIKPLRVQGAFVKDSEVEAIMRHLKQFSNGENYDKSVMEEIERAAQKCSKKGSSDDRDDDGGDTSGEGYLNDRQFLDAVELAVNSGKIATSLIQRKLSIGYGKAAKFIDIMEDMGIVGEGNGPKPREVLISADEWREKLARSMLD